MNSKTYSIFGAGAAGLYTAWRLLDGRSDSGKALKKGDTLELYDWGQYHFSHKHKGTRTPGGRVCTWHYQDDPARSYIELGGMRYSHWDGTEHGKGHRIVTTVIAELGLEKHAVPSGQSLNPLFCVKSRNTFLQELTAGTSSSAKRTMHKAMAATALAQAAYRDEKVEVLEPEAGPADAVAEECLRLLQQESVKEGNYKTLAKGYSALFSALFDEIVTLAKKKGVYFEYYPNTRLYSISEIDGIINYSIAVREDPDQKFATKTTHAAWLAMPRYAIDLVAEVTRSEEHLGIDVLNHRKVQLYRESVTMQPACKVGMFFETPWWSERSAIQPPYPAQLANYAVTRDVLKTLAEEGFPKPCLKLMSKSKTLIDTAFADAAALIKSVEQCISQPLSSAQEELLLSAAACDTIGPSLTDMPLHRVVYFGDNATDPDEPKVYGLLASCDPEMFTALETPDADNYQPLNGPCKAPEAMVKLLRRQLAKLHFGPGSDLSMVPAPLDARYMDWSKAPFNGGHHVYKNSGNVSDIQHKIRKPSQLMDDKDIPVFIVGETYSNDQGWVEGAFCTAESVLNDFFDMRPIVSNKHYPFLARP